LRETNKYNTFVMIYKFLPLALLLWVAIANVECVLSTTKLWAINYVTK